VGRRQAASCLTAVVAVFALAVAGVAAGHWDYSYQWVGTSFIEPHPGAGCHFTAPIDGGSWFLGRCYDPEKLPDCKSIWVRVTAVALDESWRSIVQDDSLQSVGAALDLFASFRMVLVWIEVWDVFLCDGQPDQQVPLIGRAYKDRWSLDGWSEGVRTLPSAMSEGSLIAYWIGPSDTESVTGSFDLLLYAAENYYSGMGIGATGRVTFTCTWVEDEARN
jgi:hypothetical protein